MTSTEDLHNQDPTDEENEAVSEALAAARVHRRKGRAREMASIYDKVLSIDPNNLEALQGMAEITTIAKNPQAALPIYAKILHQYPENLEALNNRGIILMQMGDAEASEFSFRKALRVAPDDLDSLNNLGFNLIEQKRFDEAKHELIRACNIAPEGTSHYYNLALLYMRSEPKETKKPLKYLRQALRINPHFTDAHINASNLYSFENDLDTALDHIDKALLARPDDPIILFNKGVLLRRQKKFSEALNCLTAAKPDFPEPHKLNHEIGTTHYEAGDLKNATAFFVTAISSRVNYKQGYLSLGKALAETGQLAKAKEAFRQAGNGIEVKQRLNTLNILTGEKDPWPLLREAFDIGKLNIASTEFAWAGEKLDDCISIHTGGMQDGEIILFARLIEDLKQKVKETIIFTNPLMMDILPNVTGVSNVMLETEFDNSSMPKQMKTTHMYSLPDLLGLKSGELPMKNNYIKPLAERERLWDQNTFNGNELKIGLCWFNSGLKTGPQQELRLEEFEPILELKTAQFIALTQPNSKLQTGHLMDLDVTILSEYFRDLEDLLAAIAELDIIMTADVVTAHLAGAMNKRTFVLLPLLPNWFWKYKGQSSSFYPNTTILRQSVENDWDRPIQKAKQLISDEYDLR